MAYLVVLKGQNQSQTISLDKDRVVLGRNANCDVVFPANDFAVSREHACISRAQNKYYIEDLGSRNGTFVNNQQISGKVNLKDADKVRICDFLYSFHETAPVRKPTLPNLELGEQTLDEPEGFSTFEASVSHSSHVFLEAQTAERLRMLMDISNNLNKTLELDRLLPQIVDNLFQIYKHADRCFVILREEIQDRDKTIDRLIPKVIKTRRPQDESSASYSRSIVRECCKTVQAFLSDDATQDQRFNMAQSIADFRIRSVMCAPLWSQEGKAFGVIQLDTQDRGKKFTQEDLNLLMAIASQASTALENARMHETLLARELEQKELYIAREVQRSFLPSRNPSVVGYSFFSAYEPAQAVGGDYYGFIPLPGQSERLAILLGDVAGKGIPAALLMAKLSSDANFAFLSQADPAKAVSVLNDLLYPSTSQMDRFVTLAAAVLDLSTHSVTLVNAGHTIPMVVRRQASAPEGAVPAQISGLPLGVMESYPYASAQITLEPGDCLILYSDGVTEAMDRENKPINLGGINKAVADGAHDPTSIVERIVKNVKQHASGRSQHDDITLVCIGRNAP